MLSSPPTVPRYTVADLERFPRDNRYELLDGVLLVTPLAGMPHQSVHRRLWRVLDRALEQTDLWVFGPRAVTRGDRTWLEPDLLVTRSVPAGERALDWRKVRDMPLVVEIAGRGSRRYDVDTKAPAYLMLGVREAWVLDLGARTLQVFCPGEAPASYQESYDWHTGREDVPVVHVDVRDVFTDVSADEDSAGD